MPRRRSMSRRRGGDPEAEGPDPPTPSTASAPAPASLPEELPLEYRTEAKKQTEEPEGEDPNGGRRRKTRKSKKGGKRLSRRRGGDDRTDREKSLPPAPTDANRAPAPGTDMGPILPPQLTDIRRINRSPPPRLMDVLRGLERRRTRRIGGKSRRYSRRR